MSVRNESTPGRAFLVGCPRSGTTLLQSLLLAHPEVVSFPETFFFVRVITNPPERVRRRLHVASAKAPGSLRELDALGIPADPSPPLFPSFTIGGYARRFVRRMDRAAEEAEAQLWVEKTPRHARHVDVIERHVPAARFVHIVRSGEAVVASMREAHHHEPSVWKASAPDELVAVWRRYVRYTLACVGRPRHTFVRYERLVAETSAVIGAVCDFLQLRADQAVLDQMLTGYRSSARRVTGRVTGPGASAVAEEPWKAATPGAITNRNDEKFRRVFTEDERLAIAAAVAEQDAAISSIPFL